MYVYVLELQLCCMTLYIDKSWLVAEEIVKKHKENNQHGCGLATKDTFGMTMKNYMLNQLKIDLDKNKMDKDKCITLAPTLCQIVGLK